MNRVFYISTIFQFNQIILHLTYKFFWEVKDKMKNETFGSLLKDWIQVCSWVIFLKIHHGQKPPQIDRSKATFWQEGGQLLSMMEFFLNNNAGSLSEMWYIIYWANLIQYLWDTVYRIHIQNIKYIVPLHTLLILMA